MDTCFITINHKYDKVFFNTVSDLRRQHGGAWHQNYSATAMPKENLEKFLISLDLISRDHAIEIDVSVSGIATHIGHSVRKVYVALSFPFNRQLLQKIQSIRQSKFPGSEWHADYRAYYIAADDADNFIANSMSAAEHEGNEIKSRIIGEFRDFDIRFEKFDKILIKELTTARHQIFGASFDSRSKLHRIPSDDVDSYIRFIKTASHIRGVSIDIVEIF